MKAGKLPVPARIIQSDVVGPSLGKEAISASMNSFAFALLVVLLYMVFYYSGAGLGASLALIVNMFFIFGILDAFGAVLTLPGMAGIVLTIGMAVDANVLIYDRIREELATGKAVRTAIADGYKGSRSAIIDANVTHLVDGDYSLRLWYRSDPRICNHFDYRYRLFALHGYLHHPLVFRVAFEAL